MRVSEHLSDISGFLNHSSSLFPKLFKSKSWKEWLFCSVELGDGLIKGQTWFVQNLSITLSCGIICIPFARISILCRLSGVNGNHCWILLVRPFLTKSVHSVSKFLLTFWSLKVKAPSKGKELVLKMSNWSSAWAAYLLLDGYKSKPRNRPKNCKNPKKLVNPDQLYSGIFQSQILTFHKTCQKSKWTTSAKHNDPAWL